MSKYTITVELTEKELRAAAAPLNESCRWRTFVPEEDQKTRARRRAQNKIEAVLWFVSMKELQAE